MASAAATFESGRLQYNAKVMPCRRCDDITCLRVDKSIAEQRSHVLQTIIEFMQIHRLESVASECPRHAADYAAYRQSLDRVAAALPLPLPADSIKIESNAAGLRSVAA